MKNKSGFYFLSAFSLDDIKREKEFPFNIHHASD